MNKHEQWMNDNPEMKHENPEEWFIRSELAKGNIVNSPVPEVCPICEGKLTSMKGGVGEEVLVCELDGVMWEDAEGAIRIVI